MSFCCIRYLNTFLPVGNISKYKPLLSATLNALVFGSHPLPFILVSVSIFVSMKIFMKLYAHNYTHTFVGIYEILRNLTIFRDYYI